MTRKAAEVALEDLATAKARFDAARTALSMAEAKAQEDAGVRYVEHDVRIGIIDLHIAKLEAEDDLAAAAERAATALDAADVAADDPVALACDAESLRSDLDPLVRDVERLSSELAATSKRVADRIGQAREGALTLMQRRRLARQPPSRNQQRLASWQAGSPKTSPGAQLLAILAAPVAAAAPSTAMIGRLREERSDCEAAISAAREEAKRRERAEAAYVDRARERR